MLGGYSDGKIDERIGKDDSFRERVLEMIVKQDRSCQSCSAVSGREGGCEKLAGRFVVVGEVGCFCSWSVGVGETGRDGIEGKQLINAVRCEVVGIRLQSECPRLGND